jgi:ribosomal protein S30
MAIRFLALFCRDLSGPDALVTVELIDRDNLDRDAGAAVGITIKLTNAEKQAFQDIRDRARAKYQARITKATADRAADPQAPVDVTQPLAGEVP